MIPLIKDNYVNSNGEYFCNVREIAYKKGELIGNLGVLVAETGYEKDDFIGNYGMTLEGSYIYQTYNNPTIAYKIYKEFADYGFNGYKDDILIQKLQSVKSNIDLTKFPTGVVTLDGRIIGQEIPYYDNAITLLDYVKKASVDNRINVYIKILKILQELFKNGILYLDIHPKNFMVNADNDNINLIDFDSDFICFDTDDKHMMDNLFKNFMMMIEYLEDDINMNFNLDYIETFDDGIEKILKLKNS